MALAAVNGACGGAITLPATAIDAGSDASAGVAYRNGSLSISQLNAFTGTSVVPIATATASFVDVPAGTSVAYEVRSVGDCRVVRVSAPADVLAGRGANYNVSAGPITIRGGAASAAEIRMAPNPLGRYVRAMEMTARWAAGDPVAFAAEGGAAVPGFQTTLTFPARVAVTSPAAPMVGAVLPLPQEGFSVEWVAGSASERVAIRIFQPATTGATTAVSIECIFSAAAGSGTVPTAVLREFRPRVELVLNVVGSADARVMAGSMPVELVLQNVGLSAAATRQWE